jgi:molybdate transport system substrate-binding protein
VRAGSSRPRRDQRYPARAHARPAGQARHIDAESRSVRRLSFEAFRKAEAIRSDARSVLEKKALQLTGGADSAAPPGGRNPYGWHIAEGRADMFLAYCTAARDARQENAELQSIALPDALAVSADYGLTVMADASPGAYQFALFILSSEGQRILAAYGFSTPGLSP